jgi:LmbE family N-acetylglucosaminyl deacetylase
MRSPPPFETPLAIPRVEPARATVLIVDGDPQSLQRYIDAIGDGTSFTALPAHSGEAAIECLNRFSAIECVICAVDLPDMDGFEVLRASKIIRPLTPVLLVTSMSNPSDASLAIRERADDMLIVPVDINELRTRVTALVDKGRRARAARARTVLAVGAHPDDVEIGVAGTLIRHIAAGDRVIHLLMTDGEVGGRKEERVSEAEESANTIGMTLVRGALRDAFLSDARETVAIIEKVVCQFSPSVVYVHSPRDGHQDHRATFHATMSACRGVPQLCGYQSPSSTVEFRPNRFIDIGDYLDAKIAAINIYRSQTTTRLYLAEDMIRATARYWGRHAAHRLVEPLEVIWQLMA